MGLVLPTEAQATPAVWNWLEAMIAGNGPIRRLLPVAVRQSMANGGGPACLRLRLLADPSTVDPRARQSVVHGTCVAIPSDLWGRCTIQKQTRCTIQHTRK